MGSSAVPAPSIWKKWSITVKFATPACSAVSAVVASVLAIADGSAGREKFQ